MAKRESAEKVDMWMPLYIGDYLADTTRLTTIQHGAYLLLLMDYWRKGPLPNDDLVLAQIARMTPDAWSMHGALLKHFFSIADDGMLHHKRADDELSKAKGKRGKAVEKATLAASARWGNTRSSTTSNSFSNASGISGAMHMQCPSPLPSQETTTTGKNAPSIAQGQGVLAGRQAERADDNGITPSLAASYLMKQAGISGGELLRNLTDVIASEFQHQPDLQVVVSKMLEAQADYMRSKPKLSVHYGLAKFFGEGLWRDRNTWPWKKGSEPSQAGVRKYANA